MPLVLHDFKIAIPNDEVNRQIIDQDEKWGFKVRIPSYTEKAELMPYLQALKTAGEKHKADKENENLENVGDMLRSIDGLIKKLFPLIIGVVNVVDKEGKAVDDIERFYKMAPDVVAIGIMTCVDTFIGGIKQSKK